MLLVFVNAMVDSSPFHIDSPSLFFFFPPSLSRTHLYSRAHQFVKPTKQKKKKKSLAI